VSGSDDKSIKIWDISSLKFKSSFLGHKNWIRSVKFNSDATQILSGGDERKLNLWDT
jgi:centriolar protein POC1